jgi:energy-coupling factor transporter ATP-binding protein EcfA2
MELIDLEINNIGPFKGSQKISFRPSGERFVHIVIGANGSGKTTLLNAICWGLGLYDPRNDRHVKRWVYRDCELGSVKLKVQVDGKIYEIFRTSFEPINSSAKANHAIQISLLNGIYAESIKDSEAVQAKLLSNIKNTDFYRLLVFDELFFSESLGHVFESPDFVAWAKHRLVTIEIPAATVRGRERIIAAAIEYIGGPCAREATGPKMIGAILLHCLFREWIRTDQSSIRLSSLNAESVPWLLDGLLSLLDSDLQSVAASLIDRFYGQVIIFCNDGFADSANEIFAEEIVSVSALRVGWNLWGGGKASLFGRSLELTREDGTEFSELISHGD